MSGKPLEHIVPMVMEYMIQRPNQRITVLQMSEDLNVIRATLYYHLADMMRKNLISGTKEGNEKAMHFFMTAPQFQYAVTHYGSTSGRLDLGLIINTEDIPARLSYLERIKERSIFGGDAALNAIIDDYRRTMNIRNALAIKMEGLACAA